MPYEAILFDMDGVIVDTRQSVTAFWENLAEKYQVHLTRADFEQHIYGCPVTHTLDLLFPPLSPDERQSILSSLVDYETNLTYPAVKGVIPFLRTLKQQDIPTALVTSGDRWKVDRVITQLNLKGLFTIQITVSDIRQGKPHPECYLLAAQCLQRSPEQCIVFEDAISGVKAAVAAGALCVGIQPSNHAPLLQAGAYWVVPDFTAVSLQDGQDGAETALNLQIGSEHSLLVSSQ